MPDNHRPISPARRGAREEMFRRRRRTVLVAAVVAVTLILFLLTRCGGSGATGSATDPSGTAGTSSTAPSSGTTTATATAGQTSTAVKSSGAPSASLVPVVQHGPGTFTTVDLPGPDVASKGRQVTYAVQIENGIGADGKALAAAAQHTLVDERGWQTQLPVHFVKVSAAQLKAGTQPDIIVTFASPDTVDKLCAPAKTNGEVSCANNGRAVLNYLRWQQGVPYYPNDLTEYREYMVNHEVGHLLGFGHRTCPGPGKPAPVMQQQTLGLHGCVRDPWPHHDNLH